MKISFLDHKRVYKRLFDSDDGKKVLHDLCNKYHMLGPTVRKGDTGNDVFIREGARQVILYLLHQVNYDINSYIENQSKYRMEIENERYD